MTRSSRHRRVGLAFASALVLLACCCTPPAAAAEPFLAVHLSGGHGCRVARTVAP